MQKAASKLTTLKK